MDPLITPIAVWIGNLVAAALAKAGIDQGLDHLLAVDWADRLAAICEEELQRTEIEPADFKSWLREDRVDSLLSSGGSDHAEVFFQALIEDFPGVDVRSASALTGSAFLYFLTELDPSHASAVVADRMAVMHDDLSSAQTTILSEIRTMLSVLHSPDNPTRQEALLTKNLISQFERIVDEAMDTLTDGKVAVNWRGHRQQSMALKPATLSFAATNTSRTRFAEISSIRLILETFEPIDKIHHTFPEGIPNVYQYKVEVSEGQREYELLGISGHHVLAPAETDVVEVEVKCKQGLRIEVAVEVMSRWIDEPEDEERHRVGRATFEFGVFDRAALLELARSAARSLPRPDGPKK